jgi:hypothetical protein
MQMYMNHVFEVGISSDVLAFILHIDGCSILGEKDRKVRK